MVSLHSTVTKLSPVCCRPACPRAAQASSRYLLGAEMSRWQPLHSLSSEHFHLCAGKQQNIQRLTAVYVCVCLCVVNIFFNQQIV